MHPAIRYKLAKAHLADLHRRAQRDALPRAARRARRTRDRGHSLPGRSRRRARIARKDPQK